MTAQLTDSLRDRTSHDAQDRPVAQETTSPRAIGTSMPTTLAPVGDISSQQARLRSVPKIATPAGDQLPEGHPGLDTHAPCALGTTRESGQSAKRESTPTSATLADPTLALAADVLDDLERVKLANQNRLRALTRDVEDTDGEMRGFGLDESHPDVARLAALVAMLDKAEHDATLNLQRVMRRHPLGPWVKAQRGIGEKQAARLLAKIGDPYWNFADDKPRTVSALWAYCGLHVLPASRMPFDAHDDEAGGSNSAGGDPSQCAGDAQKEPAGVAARRQKGQKANWSTLAKTRAWLVIQSCMKQLDAGCKTGTGIAEHLDGCACSPYRVVIDQRRQHTAQTHPEWTPAHSLNDAMRVASKALLRDLWREARRIHEGEAS